MKKKTKTAQQPSARAQPGAQPAMSLHDTILAGLRRYDILVLFILLYLAYNTIDGVGLMSGDTAPATFLPLALLNNHNVYLDFATGYINSPDFMYAFPLVQGHHVSLFPIVTPVLVTPVYAVSVFLSGFIAGPYGENTIFYLAKASACVIAALAGVFVYLSAKELFSQRIAVLTTFIFAFATSTWSVSSQALWQHGTVELLLAALIYLIVRNEKKESLANIVIMGILSGLFVFNRPPDSLLLIPVLCYMVWWQRKKIPYYLIGGIVGGLPFFWYNYSLFGNVFGGYAENLALFSLNTNFMANYLGLLISPNVGLFVYCPVLLLSLAGYYVIFRQPDSRTRTLFLVAGISVLLEILLYSFFTLWSSSSGYCYGTRFLTGLVPILCLALGFFLDGWFGSGKAGHARQIQWLAIALVGGLVLTSVGIQAIGSFLYPYSTNNNMSMSSDRAWDITDSVIVRSYTEGADKIPGISVYLLPPLSPLVSWDFSRGK